MDVTMLDTGDYRADPSPLLTTACAELDLRANHDSERAVCRTAFPRELASLAEPALGGLSQ
jgi:hypothetical protein